MNQRSLRFLINIGVVTASVVLVRYLSGSSISQVLPFLIFSVDAPSFGIERLRAVS